MLTCEVLREELRLFAEGRLRQEVEDVYTRIRKQLSDDWRDVLNDYKGKTFGGSRADTNESMDSLGSADDDRPIMHLAGYSAAKEMKDIETYEKEIGVIRSRRRHIEDANGPSLPVVVRPPSMEEDIVVEDLLRDRRAGRSPSPNGAFNIRNSDETIPTPKVDARRMSDKLWKDPQQDQDKPLFDEVVPFGSIGDVSEDVARMRGPGEVVHAPSTEPEKMDTSSCPVVPTHRSEGRNTIRTSSTSESAMMSSAKHLAQYHGQTSVFFEENQEKFVYCKDFRSMVYNKVHCPQFDYMVGALILMNSFSIGVQTDYAARHRGEDSLPMAFRSVELTFCAFFTAELTMRLIADYHRWFSMPGWQWNIFDSVVVLAQIFEEMLNVIAWAFYEDDEDGTQDSVPNFSFMRVLRILRLVRIIRLVRILRFIGELRTLVTSILSSLKSLAWTVVLLLLIIYSVSVYLTQVVRDTDYHKSLDDFYGNLLISMLTLFQCVTGGIDWNDALEPLVDEIHVLLSFVLGLYIAFTVLAVMNVVTGVFVESALLSANHDQAMYMVNNMRDLFLKANDGNPQGSMAWEDFKTLLDTKQMSDFFKAIDVDMNVQAAHSVFQLLDMDKSGSVELDEFVTGCARLRGQARALDLHVLLFEMREMSAHLRKKFHEISKPMSQLRNCLRGLERGDTPKFLTSGGTLNQSGTLNQMHTSQEAPSSPRGTTNHLLLRRLSGQPDMLEEEKSHLSPECSSATDHNSPNIRLVPGESTPSNSRLKPSNSGLEFEPVVSVVSLLCTAPAYNQSSSQNFSDVNTSGKKKNSVIGP